MPPGGQRAKADTGEIGSCWVNTVLYVVCSVGFLCGSLTMELVTKDQEHHSLITHLIALKHFPKSYVKCSSTLVSFVLICIGRRLLACVQCCQCL